MKELFKNKVTPWWNSKMSFLFAIAYLHFYLQEISFWNAMLFIFAFTFSGFFLGFTGHLINDWFDFREDEKVLKFNSRNYLGNRKTSGLILLSILLSYLPWLFFQEKWLMIVFISSSYLVFILYSIPFFRFKEKRVIGVISDVMYAYLIPTFIIYYFEISKFDDFQIQLIYILILIWILFVGIQQIIIHQLNDLKNDKRSGTNKY